MKSAISALMDGELEARELHEPLSALGTDSEARETWRTYHLISDTLRGGALLSADCAARVAQRLAQEPALVGPLPSSVRPPDRSRWFMPSALAASLAAVAMVAMVGWVALAPQQGAGPAPAPIAQAERAKEPARLPLTSAAQDYLIAHQAFSPRNSLQGMAPYVRSVSDQAVARKP